MSRFTFPVLLLVLLGVTAAAQDAVTIKLAYPKEGQRSRVTVEDKSTTKTVFNIGGMEQSKEEIKTKSLVYVDEIIANPKNQKRPDKVKRTYEKAVVGLDGKSTRLPLEGKTVLIEKKDGTYSFSIDGKPLEGESRRLLADEFDKPESDIRGAMFPNKPVKPGEKWKIDPDVLFKAMGEMGEKGPTFDKAKVTAEGTLVKAYKKDGKQFGVIEFTFEAPVTALGEKVPLTVNLGKMTMKLSGDVCIDGTALSGKSTFKVQLGLDGSTKDITLKIAVDQTENRTVEQLPMK